MQNYYDPKCVWGYITICDECINKGLRYGLRHVDTNKVVNEFPLGKCCEVCGKTAKQEAKTTKEGGSYDSKSAQVYGTKRQV